MVRVCRGCEDGGASLECPGDTNLSGRLAYRSGDFFDDIIFEQLRLEMSGLAPRTLGTRSRVLCKHQAVPLAEDSCYIRRFSHLSHATTQ